MSADPTEDKAWTVTWGLDGIKRVESLAELDEVLDVLSTQFRDERAVLAVIEAPSGASLAIGLGRASSYLNFIMASKDPPYYSSVGDADADGAEVFLFADEWSEYPKRNLVPIDVAREAARHFFEYGERTPRIAWEID